MTKQQLKVEQKQIATGCLVIIAIAIGFLAVGAAAGICIYKYFF